MWLKLPRAIQTDLWLEQEAWKRLIVVPVFQIYLGLVSESDRFVENPTYKNVELKYVYSDSKIKIAGVSNARWTRRLDMRLANQSVV